MAGTGPVPGLAGQTDGAGNLETFAGRWLVFSKGSALLAWDVAQARVLRLLEGQEIAEIHPIGETLFVLTWDKNARRQRLWASRLDSPRALPLFAALDINVAGWRDGRFISDFPPIPGPIPCVSGPQTAPSGARAPIPACGPTLSASWRISSGRSAPRP